MLTHNQVFTAINKTLSTVFPAAFGYAVHVPSFMDRWGYNLASKDKDFNPFKLTEQEVDQRLARLLDGDELKFLDGSVYRTLFTLPKCIRQTLSTEDRIITEDAPLVIP